MELYPIKFNPISKQRIWGGKKLKNILNKNFTNENIGESWEISDVENNVSFVSNGLLKGNTLRELVKKYKGLLVGEKVYNQFRNDFPVLIKFIDAKTPLSIQVHPSNKLAKERHNTFGKNEMWYVMDCDNEAELIVGFNKNVSKEEYIESLNKGEILDILNSEKIKTGDTFYIPTGRVHAIGAGTVLAEIQQTSDVTYRIYDYNRIDSSTGKQRELHTDLALDAIDFNSHTNYKTTYNLEENKTNKLVHSPYFKTDIININQHLTIDYNSYDSFVIYICVEGSLDIECNGSNYSLTKGETILFPATIKKVNLNTKYAKVISVYF